MEKFASTGTERTTDIEPEFRVFAWARNPNR